MPPAKLDTVFQSIYFKALPSLKVNRNITKPIHTLPYKFQGLGIPNPNIEVLALKLHLIQNHWGSESEGSKFLLQAYETIQMEIGSSANIFTLEYKRFHVLASDGWFKHLWELCNMFSVNITFNECHDIPMTRVNDKSIMDEIILLDWYSPPDLVRINRVRKLKQVHCLGDITLADGRTTKPTMFNRAQGTSSLPFPTIEKPTTKDFKLWKDALHGISDHNYHLPFTLGSYLRQPHVNQEWHANEDITEICQQIAPNRYHSYRLNSSLRATRFGRIFHSRAATPAKARQRG